MEKSGLLLAGFLIGFIFLTPGIYVLLYLSGASHSGLDPVSTDSFSPELNLQRI